MCSQSHRLSPKTDHNDSLMPYGGMILKCSMHIFFKEIILRGKGQPFKHQFLVKSGDSATWLPFNLSYPVTQRLQN